MNLLFVPLTIGLPAIDESLDKLLVAMETFPNVAILGDAIGLARIIGLLLACFAKSLLQMIILFRVNKHKEAKMETYIKAVLFYEPKA